MRDSLPGKPMIPTHETPNSIIGDLYPIFLEHYKAAERARSAEEFEQLMKPFSQDIRKKISVIYEILREHGFYPNGLAQNGNIKWSVMLDNDWLN